jgi:hypothetical protein
MSYIDPWMLHFDWRPVSRIRVVVNTLGASGPTTSDFQWSMYLIFPNNTGSVRVNMRSEFGYPTGILEWSSHDGTIARHALRRWDFRAAPGLRVHHIAQIIYSHGQHLYEMSGGFGWRFWM